MSAGNILDVVFREYRQLCEDAHVPCPPAVNMLDEHQRRALMLLASVIETQLRAMVEKEKSRG